MWIFFLYVSRGSVIGRIDRAGGEAYCCLTVQIDFSSHVSSSQSEDPCKRMDFNTSSNSVRSRNPSAPKLVNADIRLEPKWLEELQVGGESECFWPASERRE